MTLNITRLYFLFCMYEVIYTKQAQGKYNRADNKAMIEQL